MHDVASVVSDSTFAASLSQHHHTVEITAVLRMCGQTLIITTTQVYRSRLCPSTFESGIESGHTPQEVIGHTNTPMSQSWDARTPLASV